MNLLDGHTVAVDAEYRQGSRGGPSSPTSTRARRITMAPLVAEGKVLVGNSGGEMGVRGWLTALDAGSGKIAWRAYSTGPDKDALIGPDYRAPYPQDQGKDLGVKSWAPEQWKIGGGTVWGWISYDPELKLIYYGTGNPGPWNAEQRPGDNKWTAGVFARDITHRRKRAGSTRARRTTCSIMTTSTRSILVDWPGPNGTAHPSAASGPSRNGYFYVQDRRTGRILSADPYGYINAYKGVDLKTGRIIPAAEKEPKEGRVVRNICPGRPAPRTGTRRPSARVTGLVYIPHLNLCMDMGVKNANYIAGHAVRRRRREDVCRARAAIAASSLPGTRSLAARCSRSRKTCRCGARRSRPPAGSSSTGPWTAGSKPSTPASGKLLWQFKTGSGIIGQPISYRGPDGRQYIAVPSGVGGWAGAIVVGRPRREGPDGGARLRQCGQGSERSAPRRVGRSMSSRFRNSLLPWR